MPILTKLTDYLFLLRIHLIPLFSKEHTTDITGNNREGNKEGI